MSTLKSSAENLTLNADGSGNDIILQSNGSTKVTIDGTNSRVGIGVAPGVQLANLAGTGTNIGAAGINWNSSEASKYVAQFRNGADPSWGISVKLGLAAPEATDKYIDFIDDDGVIQSSLTGTGEAAGGLAIQTAGTERLKIASAGDVTVSTADLIFGTAGKGICLGVTTNTDANTLDDYEEGTWTPQITSTSGGSSMVYDGNTGGFYRRIGDSVFIWGFLGLTDVGNLQNGSVQIKNFPFGINTAVASTSSGCLVTEYSNTSQVMSGPWLRYNTTERFVLYYANSANTQTAVLGGAINNTFSMRFYGQYLSAT